MQHFQQIALYRGSQALVLLFTLSIFLPACVKQTHISKSAHIQTTVAPASATPARINLNTAAANELETLPGIGKALAARIIEHREKYGAFRRPEHLIIVRGISDRKFRAMRELISVE